MTIEKIVDYVLRTPYNTNRAVLTSMLKQLLEENGGSDTPGGDIIYDGGEES